MPRAAIGSLSWRSYFVNGDSGSKSKRRPIQHPAEQDAGLKCISMGGTVQKKSKRAKQFLLTQHQQKFRAARALAQAQSRSQLASARVRNRIEKIFSIWFFGTVESAEN